jgi:streptogramin lyase
VRSGTAALVLLLCLLLPSASARGDVSGTISLYGEAIGVEPAADATGPDGNVWFADAAAPAIDRVTTDGTLNPVTVGMNVGAKPAFIARGPGASLWFTDDSETKPSIGMVDLSGATPTITEYELLPGTKPAQIALGPEGDLWFTDDGAEPAIYRVVPGAGVGAPEIEAFRIGLAVGARPAGIAAGPEGNLWFADQGNEPAVGVITPQGAITEFRNGLNAGSTPGSIAAGPEGNLWLTDAGSTPAIARITPSAEAPTVQEPVILEFTEGLQAGSVPRGISTGAEGNIWFTDDDALAPALGRITAPGIVTEFTTPLVVGEHPGPGLAPGPDTRLWFGLDAEAGSSVAAATTEAPAGQTAPTVTGTGIVGSPERCEGATWPVWNGSTPSLTAFGFDGYTWQLDGSTVEGANAETYVPPAQDAGHQLSCRVTGTYPLPSVTEVASSSAMTLSAEVVPPGEETPPAPPPKPPAGAGTLAVSPAVLFSAARASCGGVSWNAASVSVQWLLDGTPIEGAVSSTFTVPRSYDGHALSCRQIATGLNGLSSSLTSAARTVHEQPPQPAWSTGPASEQCSTAVCMQTGEPGAGGEAGSDDGAYPQNGAWYAAAQVRCVSAPWTSAAGDSPLPAVHGLAQAHTIRMTLQRMTPSGPLTLASAQLSGLASAHDTIDNLPTEIGSPFGRTVAVSYGSLPFSHGELWAERFPGSIGQPDWFAAGQGRLLYDVFQGSGAEGSFQLLYNLTAADVGARLRCFAGADDGPSSAPSRATRTSPEYAVSSSPRCAPQRIASTSGAQPVALELGDFQCLHAPSSLAGLGASSSGTAVRSGTLRISLYCALAGGCRGKLALRPLTGRDGGPLAGARLTLAHRGRRLIVLHLSARGRSLLHRKGRAGLFTELTLRGSRVVRKFPALQLFSSG